MTGSKKEKSKKSKKIVKARKGGIKAGKKRGITSRQTYYSRISKHADAAIKKVVKLLESKHPNVALGASKIILNKVIPDLKSIKVAGELGLKRILSDKEYEAALRARGIDPRTGRKIGVGPTKKDKGS